MTTPSLLIILLFCCRLIAASIDSNFQIEPNPSNQIFLRETHLQIGGTSFYHHEPSSVWSSHLHQACHRENYEVACQYTELTSRIRSNVEQLHRLKSSAVSLEEGEYYDVSNEIEVNTLLIDDLTILASFHKEMLDEYYSIISSQNNLVDSDDDDDMDDGSSRNKNNIIAKEHYHRTMGSLLACEYYHITTWQLLKEERIHQDPAEDNLPPFVYERHAISLGAFGVGLLLSDLYDAYFVAYNNPMESSSSKNDNNNNHQEEWSEEQSTAQMREAYSASYRYLLSCQYWCIESQRLLDSIDLDKKPKHYSSSTENDRHERIHKKQMKQQHQLHVHTTQQYCASANVRLGALLLTMYAAGYTLTSDDMLSYSPLAQTILLRESGYILNDDDESDDNDGQSNNNISEQMMDGIKSDQQRLLQSVVQKIQTGIEIYNGIMDFNNDDDEYYGDNRINLADSHNQLGVVYQYLGDTVSAITAWKNSLALYRELFEEYKALPDDDIAGLTLMADIAQSLISTFQRVCDALLSIGRYDEAKEMYRYHLKLRQKMVSGDEASSGKELRDEDSDNAEAQYYDNEWNNPQLADLPAFATNNIDNSIKEHRAMLDEYYKNLLNNPDGSYHELTFDTDGSQLASMATSDKVYEGSLRSIIGSLYLAKNDVREARDELELAVELLRKGIRDEEAGMFDTPAQDINGNEMSLPLYLADALLNLSYAQAGMRQWRASMTSFEDALDIYSKELSEGEAPFDRKKESRGKSRDPAQQRDGLLEKLKNKLAIQVENYNLNRNNSTVGDVNDEL